MEKHLSVRIDEELLRKLHVVADYEGRSINRHILVLIRKDIERYEKEHGQITMDGKVESAITQR